MYTKFLLLIAILTFSIFLISGFSETVSAAPEPKITICHFPPGNPENIQTITVGEPSVPDHLDHGDKIGSCVIQADVSITKQGPSAVIVNDNFTYTIDVSNAGPDDALNVIVTDVLPSGVQYVSDTDSCVDNFGTLTCSLGEITSGNSESFEITVTAIELGTSTNQASVDSDTADPDANNNDSNEVDTEILPEDTDLADVSITKSADNATVLAGENITYTIDVTNNGPDDALNVIVSDTLDANLAFVESAPSPDTQINQSLTWNLGTLTNGQTESITLTVTVNDNVAAGTTISNVATVASDTEDSNADDNETPSEETEVEDLDKLERGDNQWDTRPTFGINHETRETILVDNGFSFNGQSFSITDNHHTSFDQQSITIGTENTFSAKVYADKRLKIQEFIFGIPQVGLSHQAEMRIEVWYDFDGEIEDVKVIQKSDVIDPTSLGIIHQKIKCIETDIEEKCDNTTISAIFLEPLKDTTMAIKAIDFKFRDQTTYLNDGFDVSGKSLNPMDTSMIPSSIRNEGLILVTQTEKYSKYWISEDGRMFEMNNFGSFKEINQSFERFQDIGNVSTRHHSGFGGILQYEQNRAANVFDATEFVSELPESFAYIYPELGERIDDEMKQKMNKQEQIAKEFLEKKYLQTRW